jgi:tetratricopeptide (TPR) repeat protein
MHIKLFASIVFTAGSVAIAGAADAAAAAIDQPMLAARAAIDAVGAARAWSVNSDDRADELYDEGREAIEEGRYERAIERFDRLIALKTTRTDAALYWKAYSLAKTGNRAAALQTLTDLQKQFADSRWIKDARALEVEVKQASGQAVSPASQDDEELKLLALRGLMQSDPEQAFPVIEKILAGANSPKVKDRAMFVLSQSRSPRARDIIAGIAKGNGNPDLQLRAIKYIGVMGGQDNRQILADAYRTSNDPAVKRSILRSFMVAGDRERLFALAKSETDPTLRGEAVRQLGVMHGSSELAQLYQSETSVDIKKSIIQAMFVGGDSDKLIELAKAEKEPELRKSAIRNLGMMKRTGTTEALTSIYASDAALDVRKAVVNALFLQNNAGALVSLARNEKNPEMKKEIVSKLSIMKSKEATDYLLELLK